MLVVIYLLMSIMVGWLGRRRHIGFVGFFVLSLVITPVITLLILMMAHERRPDVIS